MNHTANLQPLEKGDQELIDAARATVLPLTNQRFEGERITSVGAAARWKDGKVFAAANVRHPSSPAKAKKMLSTRAAAAAIICSFMTIRGSSFATAALPAAKNGDASA